MMRNSRRGLAAGVNFIWDLPMTLLVKFSNIHRHRGREISLSKPPQFNSIRVQIRILQSAQGALHVGRCLTGAAHRLIATTGHGGAQGEPRRRRQGCRGS